MPGVSVIKLRSNQAGSDVAGSDPHVFVAHGSSSSSTRIIGEGQATPVPTPVVTTLQPDLPSSQHAVWFAVQPPAQQNTPHCVWPAWELILASQSQRIGMAETGWIPDNETAMLTQAVWL